MAKKFKKITEQVEPFNRYKKALLLSYYALTRNDSVMEVIEKSNEENFFENIYPEFLQYLAGTDIILDKEEDNFRTPFNVPTSMTNYNTTVEKINEMIENMQIKLNNNENMDIFQEEESEDSSLSEIKQKRGRKLKKIKNDEVLDKDSEEDDIIR